jgi:two-component system LytT family sensor kinase
MRTPFLDIRLDEVAVGFIRLSVGAAIAFLIYRTVARLPWARWSRPRIAAVHVLSAPMAAALWLVVSTSLEYTIAPTGTDLRGAARAQELMFVGTFMYFPIAVSAYAAHAAARAARAESIAVQTQLAALRAQLHPHFLFNALHSVVQLIPVDPARAADAAELVGDLLRTALEEKRDEVTLRDEWRFVSRYLDLERIRFGDRLVVRTEFPDALLNERVPSFAVQTLVENAVLHGAAPRVAPTEILIHGVVYPSELTLTVRNPVDGNGGRATNAGTGLARLRERLAVLYGTSASVSAEPTGDGGFEAVLRLPRTTKA